MSMHTQDTTVAVVGGGIGGLSAAHELAERGFDVTVYEANDRFGGKARSMPIDGDGSLHGEHGFRFYPGFYRHVTDTMKRIPRSGGGTVEDGLVSTERSLLARRRGEELTPSTETPSTLRGWLSTLRPAPDGVSTAEAGFFARRLLTLLTSCEQRREEVYDDVSWWEFIGAENRSPAYRKHLGYSTQSLVALRPRVGSARTIGRIYLQLLRGQLDPSLPAERVLDAPTSTGWIDPWVARLRDLDVDFEPGRPAAAVEFDDRGTRVETVRMADGEAVRADQYVLAVPVEVAPDLLPDDAGRFAPDLAGIERLDTAWMNGVQFLLTEDVELVYGHQVYVDSPWALTGISQRQFWDPERFDIGERGPEEVEGVLSVIVSDWDTPGIRHTKPARECTREEVVEEVWAQLRAHLDRGTVPGEADPDPRLDDDLLYDWFLDPAIVETDDGVENRSPLLINTVGALEHRPPADPDVPNLTLAADYVRTDTDLASMESANEAGRRATNAIIERTDASADPCELWPLEEPAVFRPLQAQDTVQYRLGLPHPLDAGRAGGRDRDRSPSLLPSLP